MFEVSFISLFDDVGRHPVPVLCVEETGERKVINAGLFDGEHAGSSVHTIRGNVATVVSNDPLRTVRRLLVASECRRFFCNKR